MPFIISIISNLGPDYLVSTVPMHEALKHLQSPYLLTVYYFILAWTLFDTGVGMTYALIQRMDNHSAEILNKGIHNSIKFLVVFIFIGASILLSKVGIIDLIAKGYSTMSYLLILFLIIPLLLVGTQRLVVRSCAVEGD